jgi:NADPH2:quinone reductase
VIGTVRRSSDLSDEVPGLDHIVALDRPDPVAELRRLAPQGIDRIVEVAFSDNADLDAAVAKVGTVIAAYATREDRPTFPFWPMLFDNITIQLLGSDDFPIEAKRQAATDLTAAAAALHVPTSDPLPLARIAAAHDRVDTTNRSRTLIQLDA